MANKVWLSELTLQIGSNSGHSGRESFDEEAAGRSQQIDEVPGGS